MTAIEKIKELEKNPDWFSEQEGFVNPEDGIHYVLKAFRVMREIAIQMTDYGTINPETEFEKRMK